MINNEENFPIRSENLVTRNHFKTNSFRILVRTLYGKIILARGCAYKKNGAKRWRVFVFDNRIFLIFSNTNDRYATSYRNVNTPTVLYCLEEFFRLVPVKLSWGKNTKNNAAGSYSTHRDLHINEIFTHRDKAEIFFVDE